MRGRKTLMIAGTAAGLVLGGSLAPEASLAFGAGAGVLVWIATRRSRPTAVGFGEHALRVPPSSLGPSPSRTTFARPEERPFTDTTGSDRHDRTRPPRLRGRAARRSRSSRVGGSIDRGSVTRADRGTACAGQRLDALTGPDRTAGRFSDPLIGGTNAKRPSGRGCTGGRSPTDTETRRSKRRSYAFSGGRSARRARSRSSEWTAAPVSVAARTFRKHLRLLGQVGYVSLSPSSSGRRSPGTAPSG